MAKKKQQTLSIRLERLPSRRAIERVREAYHQLSKAVDSVEKEQPIQEIQNDEPISGSLRKSIDIATRTGSND